jgi:hypothetical protein
MGTMPTHRLFARENFGGSCEDFFKSPRHPQQMFVIDLPVEFLPPVVLLY